MREKGEPPNFPAPSVIQGGMAKNGRGPSVGGGGMKVEEDLRLKGKPLESPAKGDGKGRRGDEAEGGTGRRPE